MPTIKWRHGGATSKRNSEPLRFLARLIPLVCLIAVTACATAPRAASPKTPPDRTVARLQDDLQAHIKQHGLDGAVLTILLMPDRTLRLHAVAPGRSVPPSFRLASISKVITALTLLALDDAEVLSLDDPIAKWLPELEEARVPSYPPPTIRHLLEHTSGLVRGPGQPAAGWRAVTPPGMRYLYSNEGYDLLARVVEVATGQSFADCARQRVLEPLGLAATTPCETPDPGLGIGAGGWCSTDEDIARLARALLDPSAASNRLLAAAESSVHPPCFTVGRDRRGRPIWLRQAGSAPGAGGELVLFPREGIAVVLLTDRRYLPPFFDAVWRSLFRRLDLPRSAFRVRETSALPSVLCAGSYESEAGLLVVRATGDGLQLVIADGPPRALKLLEGSRYAIAEHDEDIEVLAALARAHAASIVEFILHEGRAEGCLFEERFHRRVTPPAPTR
ncbi:MAG: beta-lactamase family protein [Candidatus Sumerlaeia bacterium]|nr:beta-lactamase family protein [Candidatus Sumerlaeia bacterium]